MTKDSYDEFDHLHPAEDLHLDQLLSEASWPEPDAHSLIRLESAVSLALAETLESAVDGENRSADPVLLSRHRGGRLRSLALTTALATALWIAFLVGRWTSRDGHRAVARTQPTNDSAGIVNPPSPTGMSPARLIQDKGSLPIPNMAAADIREAKPSLDSVDPGRPQPQPDPVSEKRRRLTQREKMQQQLESVLACLEKRQNVDASCCQSLMPRRAEFEFLLTEMIRNSTGQRQLAAVTALGFVGTDGSVPGLLQSASSESLRVAAVEAVKRCSSEQMLTALVLQAGNRATSEEYLRELAHRSSPQAALAWLHLVQTPESRDRCLSLADELSPALVNILFAELDASLMDDRMAAILSLGRRSDEQTLKRVTRLCQQFPGRWEPVAILIWNGSRSAMNTLTILQKNPERYAVLQTASIQLKACVVRPSGQE